MKKLHFFFAMITLVVLQACSSDLNGAQEMIETRAGEYLTVETTVFHIDARAQRVSTYVYSNMNVSVAGTEQNSDEEPDILSGYLEYIRPECYLLHIDVEANLTSSDRSQTLYLEGEKGTMYPILYGYVRIHQSAGEENGK